MSKNLFDHAKNKIKSGKRTNLNKIVSLDEKKKLFLYACKYGNFPMMKVLIKHSPNINGGMMEAIKTNRIDICRELLPHINITYIEKMINTSITYKNKEIGLLIIDAHSKFN